MFDNVSKLFSYNWSDVFSKLRASENMIEVPEEAAQSIKNGFYLSFVFSIISVIITVLVAMALPLSEDQFFQIIAAIITILGAIAVTAFVVGLATNFVTSLFDFSIEYEISALISAVISFAISVAILYFLMNFLTGSGPRKPLRYIVVLVLIALGMLGTIGSLLTAISFISRGVIISILTLFSSAVSFIACANIAVGCIDFCLEANKTE